MDKFYLCVFVTIVTYMASFHASGQSHLYARNQINKNITAKKLLDVLHGQSSKIEDETFVIMRKYAKHFFLKEDYETSLHFDSLQVQVLNCTSYSLLFFESVLDNFKYAFTTVLKKDKYFSDNFPSIDSKVRDYLKNLNLLVNSLQLSKKTNVQTRFNITAIKKITEGFLIAAGKKRKTSKCLMMKQDTCVMKVIVLTILGQFIAFSLHFNDCLYELQQLLSR